MTIRLIVIIQGFLPPTSINASASVLVVRAMRAISGISKRGLPRNMRPASPAAIRKKRLQDYHRYDADIGEQKRKDTICSFVDQNSSPDRADQERRIFSELLAGKREGSSQTSLSLTDLS